MATNPYLGQQLSEIEMIRPYPYGKNGGISSNSPYATAAGLEMLKNGGNAVDAAVAVSLALGVVEPYHSGIGGGCFHVFYHNESNEFYAVDARGVAPLKAYQDMFLDEQGNVDLSLTEFSGRSVAVPGLYRAMDELLKKYGTMSWAEVSMPAIRLAREGFKCGFQYARVSDTPEAEHNKKEYVGFDKLYLRDGLPRELGEIVTNPDLADTMELVAKEGVDAFYDGAIADEIVAFANRHKGLLSKEDLSNYKVKPRNPVHGSYRGYEVVSMPPPSSGGSHIIQMLNILENFDLEKMGLLSADTVHVIAETMKMMFADRSVAMGDPDFVKINQEKILSKEYAKELAAKIDMEKAQNFAPTEGIEAKEYRGCTSHFSVMDRFGNVLVQTQTIRNWWGCGVVVDGRGFVLNNAMADFSPKVGVQTTQGLSYGMANAIRPGKTPLSSMSPTIVLKNGAPVMAVGAAGGPRIITSTLQLILNTVDHKMMMDCAVKLPHMCCLSQAQGLELEYGYSADTIRLLEEKGHHVRALGAFGELAEMPNGVMLKDGLFYPSGTCRCDGGSGALTEFDTIVMEGITF